MGLEEHGESFWLGHFLAGLLADWAEIWTRAGPRRPLAGEFARPPRRSSSAAINAHGWDGEWYLRGTLDDGRALGTSREPRRPDLPERADLGDPQRRRAARPRRPLLRVGAASTSSRRPAPCCSPPPSTSRCRRSATSRAMRPGCARTAASTPTRRRGRSPRPQRRRTRSSSAVCSTAINPSIKDPDRYFAEPYVLPGNVDGPDSPYHGRGALDLVHRLGRVAPPRRGRMGAGRAARAGTACGRSVPAAAAGHRRAMVRPWRGAIWEIEIERSRPRGSRSTA